jgi:hypothetical protein
MLILQSDRLLALYGLAILTSGKHLPGDVQIFTWNAAQQTNINLLPVGWRKRLSFLCATSEP